MNQLLEESALNALLALLGSVILQTWIAITTHRIVLLGEAGVPRWGLNQWTMRETSYVLYGIALGVVSAGAGLLLAFIPVIGPLLFAALIIIAFSCFSLIFPAIAVEDEVSFERAWQMAQGNILTLIVCVFLFPVMLSLPLLAFALVAAAAPLVSLPLIAALQCVITVLTFTALSLAYAEIKREQSLPTD